ncbi:PcfJ domain-containing protein [uncultured Veillonella sp.]|uniref:PcfJ domain-containing protein n=1 Tax=uncultured Veillonella sp. TaxID=159268 RepID=UPI00280403D3|nr:PcfJ domain-containing protein [uncultured Veillonella sp.]
MKVLFNLQVQQLYDLVWRKQVTPNTPASHYHVACGHSFSNLWPMKSGGFGLVTVPEADSFYCPMCGELIKASGYTAEVGYRGTVPISLDLSIIDRGNVLDVQFEYDTVYADGDTEMIYKGYKSHVIDVLRFDFKRRKTFIVLKKRSRSDVVENSTVSPSGFRNGLLPLLWIVATPNCRLHNYQDELKRFAMVLKDVFFEKLSKVVGYKVKSIRQGIQVTNKYGALDNLLHNLVWKLEAPDAPAINDSLKRDYDDFYNRAFPYEKIGMGNVLALTANNKPFVKALIEVHNLPDTRWSRRLLHDRPFFYAKAIKVVSKLFRNRDYQKALLDVIKSNSDDTGYIQSWPIWRNDRDLDIISKFVHILGQQYGERQAFLFIRNAPSYQDVRDTANMYFELSRTRRKEVWASRIQVRSLHDTITRMQKFDKVEDEIVQQRKAHRVLADMVNGYRFTAIGSTHGIIDMGIQLNNCVSSYIKKVKAETCAIVGVYKCNEPVACIEVNPNSDTDNFVEIHQAKLKNNRGVYEDHAINGAVSQWVTSHGLSVPAYVRDIQFAKGGAM